MFCENFWRYIFDVFIGGGEFPVLVLLLCHLVWSPLQAGILKIKPSFKRQRFSFHLQPRWTNRDWIILSPSVWRGIFLSSPLQKRRQGVNSDLDCLLSVVCQHYNEIFESTRNSSYGLKISAIFSFHPNLNLFRGQCSLEYHSLQKQCKRMIKLHFS